jgi:hypothetical protein
MPMLTGLHALPPAARWSKNMRVECLRGRPLSPEELEMLRRRWSRSTASALSTTKSAALSRATGLTCCRSFRRRKIGVAPKTEMPPQPIKWGIYKIAAKQTWVGEVEATDEREAIEKAAKEFKQYAPKLIAVKRP